MTVVVDVGVEHPIRLRGALKCHSGELLGLVGPSGAGKSTLLRAIAGLIPCTGSVVVNDFEWGTLPTHRRKVGLVAQSSNLLPHLSALENVAMAVNGTRASRLAQASTWLERVNLSGLENRLPRALSGGQQQRVAIARALAREPEVLLLDEPFTSVDAATRRRLYEEILVLRAQIKCATILVTHDVKEAVLLSDEICVMADHQTLGQGPAKEMVHRPRNARIARLLGWRNVVACAAWAQSSPLSERFPVAANLDASVLVSHRRLHIRSSPTDTEGRAISVLALPYQTWIQVLIQGVKLWGVVEDGEVIKVGSTCYVTFDTESISVVPNI